MNFQHPSQATPPASTSASASGTSAFSKLKRVFRRVVGKEVRQGYR